jgi:AcrR family transcriptional regulator
MPRRPPPDRLARLIDCATQVFIGLGYRRTQMADVAAALGVAKGTLYLTVESKEALFDLVVRHADAEQPAHVPALPVPTPRPGSTLGAVRQRLGEEVVGPLLAAALRAAPPRQARAELTGVVRELYALMSRQRTAIKLIDRCAHDYPELAALWFRAGRGGLLTALERYLTVRSAAGLLRPLPDASVAARLVLETVAVWAVHRHWDPAPQVLDDAVVETAVVQMLVAGLVPDGPPRRRSREEKRKR